MRKYLVSGAGVGLAIGLAAGLLLESSTASAASTADCPFDYTKGGVEEDLYEAFCGPIPRKIITGTGPLPDCLSDVGHAGDVWIKDFYESPSAKNTPGSTMARYTFEVCWQRYYVEKKLNDKECIAHDGDNLPSGRLSMDVKVAIFHSRSTAPKQNTKADLSLTGFTMQPKKGKLEQCRTFNTKLMARPPTLPHSSWIRVGPDLPMTEWGNQNRDLSNDVMMAKPELSVKAGSFTSEKKAGLHVVTQSFNVCNAGGGKVGAVSLGLNVGHLPTKTNPPPSWTTFVDVGAVQPRKCKSISHAFNTNVGLFRGFAKVDPNKTVVEMKETNNATTFDYGAVEVGASTPTTSPPPRSTKPRRKPKVRGKGSRRSPAPPPTAPSQGQGGGGGAPPPEAPSQGQGGGGSGSSSPPESPSQGQGGGG